MPAYLKIKKRKTKKQAQKSNQADMDRRDRKQVKEDTVKGAVQGGMLGSAYGAPGIAIGTIGGGYIGKRRSKAKIAKEKEISEKIFRGDDSLSAEEYAKRKKKAKMRDK